MKPMSTKVVFNRTTTTMASNPNLNDKNTLFTMACVASMEYSLSTHQTTRAPAIMISQAIAILVHLGLYPSIQKQVKDNTTRLSFDSERCESSRDLTSLIL